MDNSLKTKEKPPKRGANAPRKRQNHRGGTGKRDDNKTRPKTPRIALRQGTSQAADVPRRGPLLTRGSNDNPVKQAEDGRGEQNNQRPDHPL